MAYKKEEFIWARGFGRVHPQSVGCVALELSEGYIIVE